MAQHHTVSLAVGIQQLVVDVWDGYTVTLSMLQPGSPWTFSFWRSEVSQTTWDVIQNEVQLMDPVYLSIDGLVQLGGRVEVRKASADRGGATLVLSGRDLAGPALSWDADPTQALKGLPLETALARLLIGVDVTVEVVSAEVAQIPVGALRQPRQRQYSSRATAAQIARRKPIDLVHPKPGEKVWQVADRIVRKAGYLLWTAPGTSERGMSLVVDKPRDTGEALYQLTRVETGGVCTGNILRGDHEAQIRDVPTTVTVFADAPRGDATETRLERTVTNTQLQSRSITAGTVSERPFPQPRYLVSQRARTVAEAHAEGQRIVAESMAGFRRYTATVQGHGPDDGSGRLYELNQLAHVRDTVLGVDEDWLVVGVEFKGSRADGQTTTLTMAPRGAIVVEQEPS